jgi:hypothetical protein
MRVAKQKSNGLFIFRSLFQARNSRRFVISSIGIGVMYIVHLLYVLHVWKEKSNISNVAPLSLIGFQQDSKVMDQNINMDDEKVHIVFSTGCNAFQDCTCCQFC